MNTESTPSQTYFSNKPAEPSLTALTAETGKWTLSPSPHNEYAEMRSGKTTIEDLMSQQLQLCSQVIQQQLALLQCTSGKQSSPSGLAAQPHPATEPSHPVQAASSSLAHHAAPAEPADLWKQELLSGIQMASEIQPGASAPTIAELTAAGGLTLRQHHHLNTLIEHFTRRTRRSKLLAQASGPILAARRNSAGFRFSMKELLYPIVARHSEGARFWDVDGNEYIDISMGYGASLFGHSAPFITEAIATQLAQGFQLEPQTALAGEVAELIHELTGMERVALYNSDTEAVLTALRMAQTQTGRKGMAIFSGSSSHKTFAGMLARDTIPEPEDEPTARLIATAEDLLVLEYGTDQALELLMAQASSLAAILVEPVQSQRLNQPPEGFLRRLRQLCDEYGIALIFDELLTGFRIAPGGAQAWFKVQADIALYGKAIGMGMPIGIIAGKALFLDTIDGGYWQYGDMSYPKIALLPSTGTSYLHPLVLAATHAALKMLKSAGHTLQYELNEKTAYLAKTLNEYFAANQVPLHVLHFGSLFRFSVTNTLDLFFYHLLDKGIYLCENETCFLSTAHSLEDIEMIIQAVKESITEMRAGDFLLEAAHSSPGTPVTAPSTGLQAEQEHTLEALPLTETQKYLWLLSNTEHAPAINPVETVAIRLEGILQVAELHRAIQRLIERHEALRTVIDAEGEWQHTRPALALEPSLIDFAHLPLEEAQAAIQDWLEKEHTTPFDLVQGPLIRFSLLKQTAQQHVLVLSTHAIIADSWSVDLMLQELGTFYTTACKHSSYAPGQPLQFREYIDWQNRQRHAASTAASWSPQLQGTFSALQLPFDYPGTTDQLFSSARVCSKIDEQMSKRLKVFSEQHGCTLFVTLLAGYTTLLSRITGQRDLLIGIPMAGRTLEGSEGLVGSCANIIPLHCQLQENWPFFTLLEEINTAWLHSYERHDYPFSTLMHKLADEVAVTGNSANFPEINCSFTLDRVGNAPQFTRLQTAILLRAPGYTTFDLSVTFIEQEGKLLMQFDYNTARFERVSIQRLQGHLQTLLESAISAAGQPLSHLRLLQPEEIQQQFIEWNATWQLYPLDKGVHQLFEAQAKKNPQGIALEEPERCITYQELDAQANRVAQALKELGIQPEQCIGILCERSIEQVIAILGTMKAGGVCLPLDPAYSPQHCNALLQEARAPLILCQQHLRNLVESSTVPTIILDTEVDWQQLTIHTTTQQRTAGASWPLAEQLAYVLYTSTPSGIFRGAQITHGNLLNLVYWQLQYFQVSSNDSAALLTPPTHSSFLWELWPYLVAGARLKIPAEHIAHSAPHLQDWLTTQHLTRCFLPNALAEDMLTLPWLEQGALKTVTTASNTLCCRPGTFPFKLYNMRAFGEQTMVATVIEVRAEQDLPPTIGVPIANTQLYILDQQQQPLPIGVAGELYIGGDSLIRGYQQRPDLTASWFVPHPYNLTPGIRLYRTGERARSRADGTLELLGQKNQPASVNIFCSPGSLEIAYPSPGSDHAYPYIAQEDAITRILLEGVATEAGPTT